MTAWRGILVSVRDPAEVAAAVAGGAAIVDVKDPARGSLGAASPTTAGSVARALAGRTPWTIAGGEIADVDRAAARHLLNAVVTAAGGPPAAVKFGLAGLASRAWRDAWSAVLGEVPAGIDRVAVAYADWRRVAAPDPREIVAAAAALRCAALLIDTSDKQAAGLLDACGIDDLTGWIAAARRAGMRVAVAGKLAIEQIPLVVGLGVDVVALRSAVCSNDRLGMVDAALVRAAAMRFPPGASAS